MSIKRMLVVRCSDDFSDEQIKFLHAFLELLGFDLKYDEGFNETDFTNSFSSCGFMFDYVYLVGHSNEDVFGNKKINFSWDFVAETIQNSECVTDECKLIIKSCKSIDDNIANILFTKTIKIQQVLGSTIDLENFSGYVGSMLFFYLTEWKNLEHTKATELTNTTTLNSFKSYLRA
jgi:hypothetical protein